MLEYSDTKQTSTQLSPWNNSYSLLRMIWARLIFCCSRENRWTLAAAGMSMDTSVTGASGGPLFTKSTSSQKAGGPLTSLSELSFFLLFWSLLSSLTLFTCSVLLYTLSFSLLPAFTLTLFATHFSPLPLLICSKPFFLKPIWFSSSSVRVFLCSCPAVLQRVVCHFANLGFDTRDCELIKKKKSGADRQRGEGWVLMQFWSRAVTILTCIKTCQTDVDRGVGPLNVYILPSPTWPAKTNSFCPAPRRLFLWVEESLCASLCDLQLSQFPPLLLPTKVSWDRVPHGVLLAATVQTLKINDDPQLATFHRSLWRQTSAKSGSGCPDK